MSNLRDFFLQLETSLSSGISVVRALNLISDNVKGWGMKGKVRKLIEHIESGATFAQAMRKVGSPFTELQISFIQFGEETGCLDKVCGTLSEHADREVSMQRELISSLIYPLFLLLLAMCAGPVLRTIASQKALMSALPAVLMNVGGFVGFIALLYGLYKVMNTSGASSVLLFVPFIGQIFQKMALCRFTRAFGVGLGAGVPLRQALDTSIRVTDNPWLQKQLSGLKAAIAQGRKLGEGMNTVSAIPSTMKEMIVMGEQSGKLPEMLEKTAVYFEDDAKYRLKLISKLLPVLIFVPIAIYVGYVIITYGSGMMSGVTSGMDLIK
jgi:type IV pilus assembly protein PilC